jgi:hypothetical protein
LAGVESSRFNQFSLSWLTDLGIWGEVLTTPLLACFTFRNIMFVGIYFLLALLAFLVRERRDADSQLLLLMMGAVGAAYAVGSYSTGWPDQFPRLLTHLSGLVLLLIFRQVCLFLGRATPEQLVQEGPIHAPDSSES